SPPLPRLVPGADAPAAPATAAEAGVDAGTLADLALKAGSTVPQFATDWAARQLCLPVVLVQELLEQLKTDHLVEILRHAGPFNSGWALTGRGRERAARLFEIAGYVGAAPVTLPAYAALLDRQLAQTPPASPQDVARALADLVLPEHALAVAGLALSAGRSLL